MNISKDNHLMLIQLILTITLLMISTSSFPVEPSRAAAIQACLDQEKKYNAAVPGANAFCDEFEDCDDIVNPPPASV